MKLRSILVAGTIMLLVAGCKEEAKFKKLNTGLEYAIFKGDGGEKVTYKSSIKFTAVGYHADSILATPYDTVVQIIDIDSMQLPGDLTRVFLETAVGDSFITRTLVDSAMKYGPVPPYAKKGKFMGYRVVIHGVIKDSMVAEGEKFKLMVRMKSLDSTIRAQQVKKDDKILSDRIAKDGVQAVKTAKGVYVQIITPGEGVAIDSGKAVTVDYKGVTLAGVLFDQSYNATSGVSEKPYTFVIGQMGAIEGWDDGLRLFKKGGKGRLYIPSALGYGARGSGPNIKPNENLIFDIEVKEVKTDKQYMEEMQKQQAEMMKQQQQQQKMQDTSKK